MEREVIEEYEMLRAHILSNQDRKCQQTINMYIVYFAIVAIGFQQSIQWNGLFLIASSVAVIIFQAMIDASNWEIEKASIYIRIFFEEQDRGMHWETMHFSKLYKGFYTFANIRNEFLIKLGPMILGVISASLSARLGDKYQHKLHILAAVIIAQNIMCFWINRHRKIEDKIRTFYNNLRR